ncbi:MAG: UDP-N-acetylglucosamine 1-carboxyvinyltransferase [Deltaproteobacteria bacterium]|nr:UDP-N-acetylglucosamine 1-carboxyvinyltransferase [Deltaproteobacteria bacterium]
MDEIIIRGGRPLAGTTLVSGAKNAALPILFASILSPERCRLENVPKVADCRTARHLLERIGVELVELEEAGSAVVLRTPTILSYEAPYELVKTMRASFLALGPLLARFGAARVATPGGCAIGSRPVDLHLEGMARMGADVRHSHGYVEASAPSRGESPARLRGTRIALPFPSVGATENLMLAASLAIGTTVIENAAREPEIVDLAEVLSEMGAHVGGAGSSVIEVHGRDELGGFCHRVIPDRIEAGTFLIAAAATGGDVTVRGARSEHLGSLLEALSGAGVDLETEGDAIRVRASRGLRGIDVATAPFPGFPTDLQAQLMAFLCRAEGESVITETIFENRFMHVQELVRLGADIRVDGSKATVRGVPSLEGAEVMATDLRASVCLVVAALGAANTTRLQRVYHLDRGYEHLEEKLTALGADLRRVRGPAATFAHTFGDESGDGAGSSGASNGSVEGGEPPVLHAGARGDGSAS